MLHYYIYIIHIIYHYVIYIYIYIYNLPLIFIVSAVVYRIDHLSVVMKLNPPPYGYTLVQPCVKSDWCVAEKSCLCGASVFSNEVIM